MAYSENPKDYAENDLLQVAEMYYVDGKPHAEIARIRGYKTRARVIAMCKAAVTAGMVRTAIVPSPLFSGERRRQLARRVRERFGLLDCVLVNGRAEMLSNDLTVNYREAILGDIARAAAQELEGRFRDAKAPCLTVTYGSTARRVADALPTGDGKARDGKVVPAIGVRHEMMDRFGANAIARDVARQLGCTYQSLPLPAMLPDDPRVLDVVTRLDLVHEAYEMMKQANMALFALGTVHQTKERYDREGRETHESNLMVLTEAEMAPFRDNGDRPAVGNVGGWWFDARGEDLPHPSGNVLFGLGLERLRLMVEARKPVILVAGADPSYIPSLAVALLAPRPLCNVWVGDEVTAHVLLGDWRLEMDTSKDGRWRFSSQEKAIIRDLYEARADNE